MVTESSLKIKPALCQRLLFAEPRLCSLIQLSYTVTTKYQTWKQMSIHYYSPTQWNESGFRPPLCTYRLNWARRTSWGWWDDWDDTVLQTQDSKFEPWRSEAEHATSRSRRLPTILTFTRGWGRNIFVSFKPPRPGTEPRTLAWKAAVLTTTLGPPPSPTQSICITFVQCWSNVEDVGPTLYKCCTHVLCLLGYIFYWRGYVSWLFWFEGLLIIRLCSLKGSCNCHLVFFCSSWC